MILRDAPQVMLKAGTRPVLRVGYPLGVWDVELTEEQRNFISSFKNCKSSTLGKLELAIRCLLVEEQNFGGRARTLHFGNFKKYETDYLGCKTSEDPKPTDRFCVIGQKTVVLGDYVPASSWWDYWSGEESHTPAYLKNQKRVTLFNLWGNIGMFWVRKEDTISVKAEKIWHTTEEVKEKK